MSKYRIEPSPAWTHSPDASSLLGIATMPPGSSVLPEMDKTYICHESSRTIWTSNELNYDSTRIICNLDWPEILQSASVNEYELRQKDEIIFHRIGVVRNGQFIDKIPETNFREMDDERASGGGMLSQNKKVHTIVNDLRLGDVFILEYTIRMIFGIDDYLDKSYFRSMHELPTNNWLYRKYSFKLIQNREEPIRVKKRFFRDDKGSDITEDKTVNKGETYEFSHDNMQAKFEENTYVPFLEMATIDTWTGISRRLTELYSPILDSKDHEIVEGVIAKATMGIGDVEGKIRKLIEFVQNQVIYVYDADVMHGHIPQTISETVGKQSGDCKAKSLLLIKLLKAIGLKSTLALVNYDMGQYMKLEMPSPFLFNHLIVKVDRDGKEYFIDPTWAGREGLLDYRSQPIFPYYLEVPGLGELQTVKNNVIPPYSCDENVDIDIKQNKATIRVETIYRGMSADNVRFANRENNPAKRLLDESTYQRARLQYPADEDISTYISNASYKIDSDNKDKNEIKDVYTAVLLKPFAPNSYIFKYYYILDISGINNGNKHSIIFTPLEPSKNINIRVKSDRFYKKSNAITKRTITINNPYFEYTTKKSLSLREINIEMKYTPKIYGIVDRVDLESLKADYKRMDDNNYGIGIEYYSWPAMAVIMILSIIILSALIFG